LVYLQGMDIPDIERVIQFMVPSSLSVCIQRFGRAGRSGQASIAILLAEQSVFQTKKKPRSSETPATGPESETTTKIEIADDEELHMALHGPERDSEAVDVNYKKKVEGGMRKWSEALVCRRMVADEYFDNPPRSISTYFLIF
jgi:superfamily II DNA/RNA helicase